MGSWTIIYEPGVSAFIVRIFGPITEQDVIACFQQYERTLKEHFARRKFNVIISVDEAAHSSLAVLKLIRQSLEYQSYREYIANIVAVDEDPVKVAMRNASGGGLPFFEDENQALEYLAQRMQVES